jgi:hypothetical protein
MGKCNAHKRLKGESMQRAYTQVMLLLLFGLLFVVACQQDSPPPAPAATATRQPATPTPAAQQSPLSASESPLSAAASPLAAPPVIADGKAMVVGRLISTKNGLPLNHAVVRLAEIHCPDGIEPDEKQEKCFWALDNAFSPSTFTDETGYFEFKDVDALDYVVLVGDMIGEHAFVKDAEDKQIIFAALPNQVTDVGEHHLYY